VLGFLIAGFLISCTASASMTWEINASRRTPAFSSHLFSAVDGLVVWIRELQRKVSKGKE
jgi:hypothetical protein